VLLRCYAGCLDKQTEIINRRIEFRGGEVVMQVICAKSESALLREFAGMI